MQHQSAESMIDACVSLRRLAEEVAWVSSEAMSLLVPCKDFDSGTLSRERYLDLSSRVTRLHQDAIQLIGRSTEATMSTLQAKSSINGADGGVPTRRLTYVPRR